MNKIPIVLFFVLVIVWMVAFVFVVRTIIDRYKLEKEMNSLGMGYDLGINRNSLTRTSEEVRFEPTDYWWIFKND